MEAAHSCGNPWCWAGEHLRWATASENQLDKHRHGTMYRGEQHHKAKLSIPEVREIREHLSRGESAKTIAMKYGVSDAAVHDIAARRSWAWLD
jgi:hypothetical protein